MKILDIIFCNIEYCETYGIVIDPHVRAHVREWHAVLQISVYYHTRLCKSEDRI